MNLQPSGYEPGRINEDGNEERHHYIALFLETAIGDAMSSCGSLATAYFYTDEEEYGRAAAIILDRFADVYRHTPTGAIYKEEKTNFAKVFGEKGLRNIIVALNIYLPIY